MTTVPPPELVDRKSVDGLRLRGWVAETQSTRGLVPTSKYNTSNNIVKTEKKLWTDYCINYFID